MKHKRRLGNGHGGAARARRVSKRKPQPRTKRVLALRKYLNGLGRGVEGQIARKEFAERVGSSLPYLEHIVQGFRRASMEFALKIERATYGIVRAEQLHPSKDWAYLSKRAPKLGELDGRGKGHA